MTKQFLIQIIPDERTRFVADDEKLREVLQTLIGSCLKIYTDGSVPALLVIDLELARSKLHKAILLVCEAEPHTLAAAVAELRQVYDTLWSCTV